jgi:hypothetical protein
MTDLEFYTKALAGAAELVAKYGEEFLPAFVCMEQKVEEARSQNTAMNRALEIARGAKSQRAICLNASRRPTSAPPLP